MAISPDEDGLAVTAERIGQGARNLAQLLARNALHCRHLIHYENPAFAATLRHHQHSMIRLAVRCAVWNRAPPIRVQTFDSENAAKRDAEMQLSPDIDETFEKAVGPVRHAVNAPDETYLGQARHRQGQPLLPEPEDADADKFIFGSLLRPGQGRRPLGHVLFRELSIEERLRRCRENPNVVEHRPRAVGEVLVHDD